jgi:hypothetical protein
MTDGELGTNVSDSSQVDEQEKILESKITKAVDKLKYYLEETDELIENNEISELRIASKRTDEIRDELRGSPCKNRPLEFRKITEFVHTFCVEEVIHKMNKKR